MKLTDIINFLKTHHHPQQLLETKFPEIYNEIKEFGSKIFPSLTIHQVISLFRKGYTKWPICPICGNLCKCRCLGGGSWRFSPVCENKKCLHAHQAQKRTETILIRYNGIAPQALPEIQAKTKKTCMERYGVSNYAKLEECTKKREQTCLKKFGATNNSKTKEWKEQVKATSLQKYGVDAILKAKVVQDKRKKTNLEKYGCENPWNNKDVQDKCRKTFKEKYQLAAPAQLRLTEQAKIAVSNEYEFKKFIKENNIKYSTELASKLGMSISPIEKYCHLYNCEDILIPNKVSSYEYELRDILANNNIKFETSNKSKLGNRQELDLYLPDNNIAIEINGNYYHSDFFRPIDYHYKKSILAESKGIFIYHLYEYELFLKHQIVINQILKLCNYNKLNQVTKFIMKAIPISLAKDFIKNNDNLIIDFNKAYGIYDNNNLIHVIAIQCIDNKNIVVYNKGLYSIIINDVKCLRALKKKYNKLFLKLTIGKENNLYYKQLGFKHVKYIKPDFIWIKNLKDIKQPNDSISEDTYRNQSYYKLYNAGYEILEIE